jgi:hypothetical protein
MEFFPRRGGVELTTRPPPTAEIKNTPPYVLTVTREKKLSTSDIKWLSLNDDTIITGVKEGKIPS